MMLSENICWFLFQEILLWNEDRLWYKCKVCDLQGKKILFWLFDNKKKTQKSKKLKKKKCVKKCVVNTLPDIFRIIKLIFRELCENENRENRMIFMLLIFMWLSFVCVCFSTILNLAWMIISNFFYFFSLISAHLSKFQWLNSKKIKTNLQQKH